MRQGHAERKIDVVLGMLQKFATVQNSEGSTKKSKAVRTREPKTIGGQLERTKTP